MSRDSSRSVLGYGTEDRRSVDCVFVTLSRPALGPTEPPMQCIPEALLSEIKRFGHNLSLPLHPVLGWTLAWAIPPFPIHLHDAVLNYARRQLYRIGPLTHILYQVQIKLFHCYIRFWKYRKLFYVTGPKFLDLFQSKLVRNCRKQEYALYRRWLSLAPSPLLSFKLRYLVYSSPPQFNFTTVKIIRHLEL
jgi:hypothetical protein